MAIIRCNKCAQLAEHADDQVGQSVPCPNCATPTTVYPTLFFVEKLLARYFDVRRELETLRANTASAAQPASVPGQDFDPSNTDMLVSERQHGPILEWFRKKDIVVQVNLRGVDTSGFFDEVAELIGGNLAVLKEVLDRIRWAQQKGHATTTIHLEQKSAQDIKAITAFCKQLYDFSFAAKFFNNKAEKNVRLVLQTAPAIRRFFDGEWLEWHALMSCLRHAKARGKQFSCARGLALTLPNGESAEIDVFLLIDGTLPVCVECKSGEFRQSIDRYLAMKKRLGLESRQFVMCIAGLSDDNARAFSAMYDMTFTNERGLAEHLQRLF